MKIMNEIDLDTPKRYIFTFGCLVCAHEWTREFFGTIFGKQGAIAKNQQIWCPKCGARLGHPSPAKNVQPETVSMKEDEGCANAKYH